MPRPTVRTSRIELVPMTPDHLPLLHSLDSDPEVMRYLLGRARTPKEIEEFWAPRCADTRGDDLGLGWWVGFHDAEFLGWWDLDVSTVDVKQPPAEISPEAGWRVRRDQWRKGYATEGARALFAHAFEAVGVGSIWAETMAVNLGSRGVMRGLGMRHVRTEHPEWEQPIPGAEEGEVRYEITTAEWRAQS